jgi:hypothetical protein
MLLATGAYQALQIPLEISSTRKVDERANLVVFDCCMMVVSDFIFQAVCSRRGPHASDPICAGEPTGRVLPVSSIGATST